MGGDKVCGNVVVILSPCLHLAHCGNDLLELSLQVRLLLSKRIHCYISSRLKSAFFKYHVVPYKNFEAPGPNCSIGDGASRLAFGWSPDEHSMGRRVPSPGIETRRAGNEPAHNASRYSKVKVALDSSRA